ncbi:LppP/LprE family lipoprotein [Frankia sp. AgPm24]|uniref:protein kinase domain-containing protein n=1 Tax=Frankia sp. AgPm24 TaxID=631128 RepID=UPI00200D4D61|nr:LppP/LprE family lipoprotein [Frankia sp. AgPm24]MCK9923879.1 LppP/LprE family lipoprotein [Frankia sp. AgPm24]
MLTPLTSDDPQRIGPYRLANRIGAGGMGVVYLGFGADGGPAAVKVPTGGLADDPEFRARFRQEVAAARRVRGSTVAAVLDANLTGERPWMATEYVEGRSLADAVATRGPLDERLVQGLAIGLADALVAIHEAGVVHRDLKPANILMAWDGPKVIDFGIARASDSTSHTRTGMLIGTLVWMAPEQLRGERADAAADIFAWGACVAFAAAGRPPFRGERAEAIGMQILTAEPDLTGLPAALAGPVRDALAKEPAARPSAADLLARLLGRDLRSAAASDEASETALAQIWSLPPTPPQGPPPTDFSARTRRAPDTPRRAAAGYGTAGYGAGGQGPAGRDASGYRGGGQGAAGHDAGRYGADGYGAAYNHGAQNHGAQNHGAQSYGSQSYGPSSGGDGGRSGGGRGAIIAGVLLAVVLLGGGIAAAVALTGDHNGGDTPVTTSSSLDATASTTPTSSTPTAPATTSATTATPSTSPTPSQTPTSTPSATPKVLSTDEAAQIIRGKGYDPDLSTYQEDRRLNVVIGTGGSAGGNPQQFAFVFADGEYRGTDTSAPSAHITLVRQPNNYRVTLRYATFDPQDQPNAPSGHADVRFEWTGTAFTALDTIPPNDPNATGSRR